MVLILNLQFSELEQARCFGMRLGTVPGLGAQAQCPGTVLPNQVWKYDFAPSDPCVLTGVALRTLKQSL